MTCLPFPTVPARAWRISESDQFPDEYVGELVPADGWKGPTRTQSGPLRLVVEALLQHHVRRGLPIIGPFETLAIALKRNGGLRPSRRHVRTDREKYEAALVSQKLSDNSRWVPCDPWGGSAA